VKRRRRALFLLVVCGVLCLARRTASPTAATSSPSEAAEARTTVGKVLSWNADGSTVSSCMRRHGTTQREILRARARGRGRERDSLFERERERKRRARRESEAGCSVVAAARRPQGTGGRGCVGARCLASSAGTAAARRRRRRSCACENVGSAGGVVLWQPRALGCVGSHGAAIAGAATGAARRARGFGGMSTIEDYAPAQQQQRERERAPTAVLGAVALAWSGGRRMHCP
jgi:hypothetical protein